MLEDDMQLTEQEKLNQFGSIMNGVCGIIQQANARNGFWTNPVKEKLREYALDLAEAQGNTNGAARVIEVANMLPERNVGELLMLINTELSEGMEAWRKNKMDDHLPNRSGLEVELADALIRILDMAAGLRLDLGGAFLEKLKYNKSRGHMHGGKKC